MTVPFNTPPMNYYYISRENKAEGPVSLEELQNLLNNGILTDQSQVAEVGSQSWQPITAVLTGTSAPTPTPPPFAAAAAPTTVYTAAPNEPLALTSLILAIVSFACGGFFLSIPAVVCGHMALSRIRENPGRQGRGLAVAGLWVGYINIVLSLIVIVFYAFFIAAAVGAGIHNAP